MSEIVFLDVEASALVHGYPVEVAWVRHDLLAGGTYLLRPTADWLAHGTWATEAEAIHGLSRPILIEHGLDVSDVAAQLNLDLRATSPLTDSPNTDGRWLRELFAAAQIEPAFAVLPAPPCATDWAKMSLWRDRHDQLDADLLITTAARRAGVTAIEMERTTQSLALETGLVSHRALDDALGHALRLAAVALIELERDHGTKVADHLHREMVARAGALLRETASGQLRCAVSGPQVSPDKGS